MLKYFAVTISIVFLLSCSRSENNQKLIGKWQGIEWLVEKQPGNYNAAAAFFVFDDKGQYRFDYKRNSETGTYKVENNMLFTKPEGGQEIMVLIEKLNGDTLVFQMNRGGIKEELTLLRGR